MTEYQSIRPLVHFICADPLLLEGVVLGEVRSLDIASYLNNYVPYMVSLSSEFSLH